MEDPSRVEHLERNLRGGLPLGRDVHHAKVSLADSARMVEARLLKLCLERCFRIVQDRRTTWLTESAVNDVD